MFMSDDKICLAVWPVQDRLVRQIPTPDKKFGWRGRLGRLGRLPGRVGWQAAASAVQVVPAKKSDSGLPAGLYCPRFNVGQNSNIFKEMW